MAYTDLKAQLLPLLHRASENFEFRPTVFAPITDEEELDKCEPNFKALGYALLAADELSMFRKGNLQCLPLSSGATSIWQLTYWLITRTLSTRSAETALDDLLNYVAEPRMVVHHVQPIAEIEVGGLEEPLEFPNRVMLRHAGNVPNFRLSRSLTQLTYGVPSPRYHFALTQEHQYQVHEISEESWARGDYLSSLIDYEKSTQQLEDVTLCLGLASEVENGVFGASRTFAPDMRIPYATEWGSWHLERSAVPSTFLALAPVEVEHAVRLARFLDGLEAKAADRIRVPMRHLNLFGARMSLVEKAIHLRVALETTFLANESGHGLADRISLRAAIVTGGNLEERRRIKQAVNKAYGLASTAVHKGSLKQTESAKLTTAAEICQKALRLFLERGGLPNDWFQLDTEGFKEPEA